LQYCGGCGAAFTEDSAAHGAQGTPADATRADPAFDNTHTDQPAAAPDPFASWYQPQQPGGAIPDDDGTWQPTQTVYSAPPRPAGFPSPQGPASPPYQPTPPPYQPGPPYPPVPPATGPSGGGRRGLFIAVAAIVVLAAGGGAYAVANSLGKHSTAQPPSQPSTGAATPAGGGTPTGGTPATGTPSSGGPRQATTPASPTPSPTLSLVTIGQSVTSSAAPQVETLLSHYFHGINARDYGEYASTLNPAQQAKQSPSTFESGYATTTDSGMTLTSLADNGPGGLVATVTFTSHQAPAQSVDHSACNAWTLNFYLVPQGTGYLIGPAPSGYQPSHSDC
jgi:hypothetical protein